jgi:hypothetical protein
LIQTPLDKKSLANPSFGYTTLTTAEIAVYEGEDAA